jgi:aspartate ammonia-lyase
MDITQNNDVFVEVSGLLKAMAVNLAKVAGDLRLMNSGPHGGLGEVNLAPLQLGSTAMPGKVNPVLPEFVIEASLKIISLDLAITLAASRGEFELNAFVPLIAESLLESLALARDATSAFRKKCIVTLVPNKERCAALLNSSLAFASFYAPILGHGTVALILKESGGDPQKAKELLEEAKLRATNKETSP